jgi:hypothetical protein
MWIVTLQVQSCQSTKCEGIRRPPSEIHWQVPQVWAKCCEDLPHAHWQGLQNIPWMVPAGHKCEATSALDRWILHGWWVLQQWGHRVWHAYSGGLTCWVGSYSRPCGMLFADSFTFVTLFHLIAYLCSTFRKLSINSVRSRPAVDAESMLRRMCTTRHQRAWTLVSDWAMLPGWAPLVQHTTTTFLTWALTSTQQRMFCRSLRMLLTQCSLHNFCRVDEHGSLRTVSL